MEQLSGEFGEKMIESMRGEIKAMVAVEVEAEVATPDCQHLAPCGLIHDL